MMRALVDTDASAPTSDEDLTAHLTDIGFVLEEETPAIFDSLCRRLLVAGVADAALHTLISACLDSPVPAAALRNLHRYLEQAGNPSIFVSTVVSAPPLLDMLITIFGGSQYMADILVRNPGHAYWLMEGMIWNEPDTVESFTAWLDRECNLFSSIDGKIDALRRTHRLALLKIGVNDMVRGASVDETTERLSNLADATAQTLLSNLRADVGVSGDHSLAVIAMGKLGGAELNYSSDIDLVFVCDNADDDVIALNTKVARRFSEVLYEHSPEGYLYRVDLRLRPDGQAGALVNSEDAFINYYENRGRPWELQAMLKARVIAGSTTLGERVLDSLCELTFHPTTSPLPDVARMREQIKDNIPQHERGLNIKLMHGGIRDIEFIAQALQLTHGAEKPQLRTPTTLTALTRIHDEGLLKTWECDNLIDAYRFLRLVEHRLQMMHQIKTHTVPSSRAELVKLAARVSAGPLGQYDTDAFLDTLSKHLNNVRTFAESFFAGEEVHPHSTILMLPVDSERVTGVLANYGFRDPAGVARTLHKMAYGSFPRLLDRDVRIAFEQALPLILESLEDAPDPDAALVNLARVASAGENEAAFYELFSASEEARRLISGLTQYSSLLAKRLSLQIHVLDSLLKSDDEVAFRAQFKEIPEFERYNPGVARRGGNEAEQRQARQREWFDRTRLGSFASAYRSRFRRLSGDGRSWVALRQLASALETVLGEADNVALFTLGSYAVGEARITSDVDLIVVTDNADIPTVTSHIQSINQWFTGGRLLKLDFRLRGEGASSPLVQDVSFYRDYFEKRLQPWERVALSKCSAWWGSVDVRSKFMDMLREHVCKPFTVQEIEELLRIRARLETLAPKKFRVWDTKRSPGGRYDLEYLTAIGMVESCSDDADFFALPTAERIDRLTERKWMTNPQRRACHAALDVFTLVEYLMDLQEISQPRSIERSAYVSDYLDRALSRILGRPTNSEQLLESEKKRVRAIYDEIFSAS